MAAAKSTPKDAQVMAAILKDMGIIDYEPRVLNQMLEFTYRYVTSILDDAQLFSSHAKKKGLDVEDVRLAIQLQMDKYFTTPPPRELLLEIARQKNSVALPLIKATPGPRLPPDRYSLTACNFRLKSTIKKARTGSSASRLSIAPLQPNSSVSKGNPAVSLSSKTGATLSVVTKAVASPTVTIVSRTNTNTTMPKTTPTPIIKFSEANRTIGPVTTTAVTTPVISSLPTSQNNASTAGNIVEQQPTNENSNKRKREDDPDDYDVE